MIHCFSLAKESIAQRLFSAFLIRMVIASTPKSFTCADQKAILLLFRLNADPVWYETI